MKNNAILLIAGVCLTLIALPTGCATSKQKQAVQQKEDMLLASGFKVIPATTPDQQQQMRTLPTDRVSAVRRNGQIYFVFPDRARNVLYVGNNNQYVQYQALAQNAQEQTQVKYEMEAINRSTVSPGWEAPWGDWDAQ